MPEAKSMNTGIKRARGDIIITLDQDCLPENEFWIEKLIKPLLDDKEISATVSDLYLPEWYWKKYPFFTRILTINERVIKYPGMDARGCAYRKKDLMKTRLFNEDPKVTAIESNIYEDLKKLGKIVHPGCRIYHLHYLDNKKKMKLDYNYAFSNGKVVRESGIGDRIFWRRFLRAIPLIGLFSLIYRFPFKKYFYLFPVFLLLIPIQHINWIYGFWKGFIFFDKESERNKEVLNEI
jgi:glycosyltransferase involved in cell wall biosynthesis